MLAFLNALTSNGNLSLQCVHTGNAEESMFVKCVNLMYGFCDYDMFTVKTFEGKILFKIPRN